MNKHSKRLLTLATLVTTTTATIHIINKVIAASACLKEMLDTDVRNYYHCFRVVPDMNGPESRMNLRWSIQYIIWIFRDADVLKSRV